MNIVRCEFFCSFVTQDLGCTAPSNIKVQKEKGNRLIILCSNKTSTFSAEAWHFYLQHGRHSWALSALLIWRKSSTWSKYWRPGIIMKYPYLSENYYSSKISMLPVLIAIPFIPGKLGRWIWQVKIQTWCTSEESKVL